MLPIIWSLGTCLLAAVGLATALHLFGNRLHEHLARLKDEVNRDAARIQSRADAADDRLADDCVNGAPGPAVRAWQGSITTDGLVKVGGRSWDWDADDVVEWAKREVESRKYQLEAAYSRQQAAAWAVAVVGGLLVGIGGNVYLAGSYLAGS